VPAVRVVLALLLALAVVPTVVRGQGEVSSELTDVAIVERDAAVEVWVRLSRPAKYQAELIDSPWRLALDFEDTAYRWSARPTQAAADPLREVRGSQYRKGVARLVIELRRKVAYTIEEDREGLRIVLPRTEIVAAVTAPPRPATPAPATPAPAPAAPPGRILPAPIPPPPPTTDGATTARVPAPPPPTPAPRPMPKGPMVYGIVVLDEHRHAYILDPAVGQVRRYAAGDKVGNGVIETIGEWTVVLKTPTGRVELRVDDAKPEAPAPAAARPKAPPPTAPR
jgi:AMIN domain